MCRDSWCPRREQWCLCWDDCLSGLLTPSGSRRLGSLSQTLGHLLPLKGPNKHCMCSPLLPFYFYLSYREPFRKTASSAPACCFSWLKIQQILQITMTLGGALCSTLPGLTSWLWLLDPCDFSEMNYTPHASAKWKWELQCLFQTT